MTLRRRPPSLAPALALAALAACRGAPEAPAADCAPPPALDVALLGERARLEVAAARFVPVFDARALPYVRVRAEVPRGLELVLASTASTSDAGAPSVPLAVTTSTRTGARGVSTFVRVSTWPVVQVGPRSLELWRVRAGCARERVAAWPVHVAEPPDELPAIAAVAELKRQARHADVRAHLEPLLPSLDPWARTFAAAEVARAHQAEGALERAAEAWKLAAERALEAKLPTQASWALRSAAFQCYWLRCAAEAEPLLDRAEALDRASGNELGLARTAFYRGLLAREQGALRRARAMMDAALVGARELGRDDDEAKAVQALALVLEDEGRPAEAFDALATLRARARSGAPAVDRSKEDSTLAWLRLRALEQARAGGAPIGRAELDGLHAMLRSARASIAALHDPVREANVILGQARAAMLDGDPGASRRFLAELAALGPSAAPLLRHPQALLLDAELALVERRLDDAERAYRRLDAASRAEARGFESDYTWRARHGVASVERARGDRRAALATLRDAIAVLERVTSRTVLREGRATFYEDRRRAVDDAISLSLELGDVRGAFMLADRAEAQLVAALDTEVRAARLGPEDRAEWARLVAAWMRDRDAFDRARKDEDLLAGAARRRFEAERAAQAKALAERFDALHALLDRAAPLAPSLLEDAGALLAQLGPRDALVAYTRVAGRWHLFFATPRDVRHAVLDGDALFGPFAGELEGLEGLYVVDGGHPRVRGLVAERLPSGRRVIEGPAIAFLPYAGLLVRARPGGDERTGAALVVADPTEDLSHARDEGALVARLVSGAELVTGASATRAAVLERLSRATLFHFAGHGVSSDRDPWASHLALASGETLALEDVLVARPRARIVVLSGCETGREARLGATTSIGLAQAFLSAGAEGVLATERVLPDRDGARFVERFYRAGGAARPATAYRAASLAALADGDDAWTAFRWHGRIE